MSEENKQDSDSDEDSNDDDDSQESTENKRGDQSEEEMKMEIEIKMKPALSSSSLFSEKDEITLLEEFKYYRKTNDESKNDWVKFHKAVGSKLSNEFTRRQISEKIRTMKKKFKRNSNYKSPHLDGCHEARVFELGKALWGQDGDIMKNINEDDLYMCNKDVVSTCRKKYVPEGENLDQSDYPTLCIFFDDASLPEFIRTKWTLIGSENAEKLEHQCTKLFRREITLSLEMTDFKAEVSRLIRNIIKQS